MAPTLARDLAQNGRSGLAQDGRIIGQIETFLQLDNVKRATGMGRSTIYDLMAENPPRFPRPVKINGERAIAWLASEIAAWQQERIAARDRADAERTAA